MRTLPRTALAALLVLASAPSALAQTTATTTAPATGFALDVENLAWALAEAGVPAHAPHTTRVVVIADGEAAQGLARALREAGIVAAAHPATSDEEALAYARAWRV